MKNYRKIKTDLQNLHILHRLNRIYNSPKTIRGPIYYQKSNSETKNYKNNTRTIYLQKTTPNSYYPVKVQIQKKYRNDYSYSPDRRSGYSPSNSGFNNNSFIYNNLNNEKYVAKDRNYQDINSYKENIKNKNLGRINELKNSLGNPNQARNIMVNNNGRKNRFITISPSHNSLKDEIKDLKYNDINIEENNYDGNKPIKYLFSKTYINKFNKKPKPNFNSRSYSNKYNPKKNYLYYLNKYNAENSPGNKSNITDINQNDVNARNYLTDKKPIANITPIINPDTPFLVQQDNNIIEEEIPLNNLSNYNYQNVNNIFLNNNFNNYSYKNIEIKLDDLIFIEGRLNDIIIALNNYKNIFDIGAINETVEFFVFYFHSSLKNKLSLFFLEQNRIVIKSAFNLNLYIIMITYHLSLNSSMLAKIIILIKQIFNLLKMNLFLLIRQIEIYYGDDFCKKNDIYFKTCNYFLIENGLDNLKEGDIINLLNRNCITIVNDVGNILNYYQTINNKYYSDFRDIYLNLSRIDEQDINNYCYNYLFNSTKENIVSQQKINNYEYSMDNIENSNNYIEQNDNFYNNITNYANNNSNQIIKQEQEDDEEFLDEIILSYKKNKEIPPFLRNRNTKKYTLVLDLEDTLISVKLLNDGKILIRPRPGLIPFLAGVKQYYEIISFSKLSKNYSNIIIEQIEENRKLFDYNLYREHCTLVGRKFVKDISRIGRDLKKIIMVDDLPENLSIHIDNGILILPYDGDDNKEDRVLYELKKLLILFYNLGYEDLRNAIKSYKNEIYQKITLGLSE